jgi:ketosteroid isomerase-like protein
MKGILLISMCIAAAAAPACGGTAEESRAGEQDSALTRAARAREELFAADAEHTAQIARLGPVDGLVRSMRGNVLYLAADIDLVKGKHDVRAVLEAAEPDPSRTTLKRMLAGGDVSADGRFGFTFGWLERTAPVPSGTATTFGTYVSTWEREDGDDEFRVSAYYTRVSLSPHLPIREGFPLLFGGAGAGGVPNPGSLEAQKRSLIRTDADFAALSVATNVSIAFPANAASLVMPFGRNFFFLLGSQEVTDFYAGATPDEVLSWTPLFAGSSKSGDLGFTVGTAVDTITHPDGKVDRFFSKYLTLWARQADGAWKFIADGGAASPAPSP